jgi:hypothetical protein
LQRTEVARYSKSLSSHYWAWLKANEEDPIVESGRYLISASVYDDWSKGPPATVAVTVARGALGAQVVRGIR